MLFKKRNELLLFFVLFLSILPVINLGGFEFPILYLLIPLGIFIFLLIIFGYIKVPSVIKIVTLFFLLIIIEIFISTFIGTITVFNNLIFPKDIIQYVARFLCVIIFFIIFYYSEIKETVFIKMFLLILIMGMSIGVLQWITWSGQVFFVKMYPFRQGEEQLAELNRVIYLRRSHGLAQHSTANGGIATFAFVFAYATFAYFKKYKSLSILLMILALFNLFASQARAGMLAFVFSIILFYIVKMYINFTFLKPTIKFLVSIILIYTVGYKMYESGDGFIGQLVYRWKVLIDTNGGARVDQIEYGLSFFLNISNYFFGISRAVQSYWGEGFHIEVEPANIFILYGIFGFLLQYGLIIYLLYYFFKNIKNVSNNPGILTLLVASFVGLMGYQVFSLGYFFFREARIGLIPWILIGVAIGALEKNKRVSVQNKK